MAQIEFRDPPPRHTLGEEAEVLRESPGVWAVVGERLSKEKAYNRATAIRRGQLAAFRPAGAFDARVDIVDHATGEREVFVRYVGEDGEYR